MYLLIVLFLSASTLSAQALGRLDSQSKELVMPPAAFSEDTEQLTVITDSFSHRDHGGSLLIKEYNQNKSVRSQLREYSGLNDFSLRAKPADRDFPWRNGPFEINGEIVHKLDLTRPEHARYFSDLVFEYILKGWFTDDHGQPILDRNRQFRNNAYRTWCTTPGVVDGDGGRDAVHGLTKELGLKPNPIFPAGHGAKSFDEALWESSEKDRRPAGWGQAFFNRTVCENYSQVFGSIDQPRLPLMDNQDLLHNDFGFVSFKLHFNAMEEWQVYRPFAGAYTWLGNVSRTRGETGRSLSEIPLIQISVSMKLDSRFVDGLEDERGESKADNWVMLAFYHDAHYMNNHSRIEDLPMSLRKLRPMGIQLGFTPSDTIMFEGSKSNYKMNLISDEGEITGHQWHPNDSETLLNGPADNAYSSCLGCHAGFNYMDVLNASDPKRGGADGLSIFDVDTFRTVKSQYGKREDFNLQLFNAFSKIKNWLEKRAPEEPRY